ncbi:xanthine dehydrogenase family protein molybdopterin-binding subunit [Nocardioides sp. YIM 152315]|uniref:xanthine dehydrogenase family protein molybdopterin-binding subunit n=1 Tax=Nocardioides sp. YIM 152315 TaxID=3031760 RepID=UPI0023DB30B7|nr:xanthine dehydrogenase family protein molybdopterin-binding subunit [Nocardioides sp. YIM 152315]MDF1605824.1 xanthine dehydrogenase family protein molybdopterin-binding subunit [Nocardioides sp. YIM 152315]
MTRSKGKTHQVQAGDSGGNYVGKAVRRKEDDRLLRGLGRYVDDIDPARQLHASVVRSMVANARITNIDVEAARSAPGVHLVLTGRDLGDLNEPLPLLAGHPSLIAAKTQRPLAVDRVRYVGEAVALIVADTRYLAEDAAELISIDYDILDPVVDLGEASSTSAAVHDDVPGNVAGVVTDGVGDPDSVFASAPYTAKLRLSLERTGGMPMETRGVLADWDPRERMLRVWDSTQAPVAIKHGLCRMFGLSSQQVEVIAPDVGGGFGTKIMLFYPEEVLVPFAARALGRPVKWIEDRWEHFVSANQERGQIHDAEVAFDAEGTILAVRTNFVHDTGAYIPYGIAVPANTLTHVLGQYAVKNYAAKATILYTNKPPVSPYRGAGRPHAVFTMERLIRTVAAKLNMEPYEVRLRNLVPADAFPYDVGLTIDAPIRYDSGNYQAGFEKAIHHLDPAGFRKAQEEARARGRYLGMGICAYIESSGPGPYEGCAAKLTDAGTVVLDVATASQGQGHATSFAQIAADSLGAGIDDVVVRGGDSGKVDFGIGTFGSRSLLLAGNAVAVASERLRNKIAAYVSELFECSHDDLEFSEGQVSVKGAPGQSISLAAIAALANAYGYPVDKPLKDDPAVLEKLRERAANVATPPVFTEDGYFGVGQQLFGSGVHAAIVEVDPEVGAVDVQKYVLVHDCGVVVNPTIVEGQVLGGLVQGLGGALLEVLPFDEQGQPQATSFMDFRMPSIEGLPEIILDHVETPSPLNPLGVKGTGEAGAIPVAAVLAEAIEDALSPFNVFIDRMPLLPHQIANLVTQTPQEASIDDSGVVDAKSDEHK